MDAEKTEAAKEASPPGPPASPSASVSSAPGAALVLAALAVLILPVLLAAAATHLPAALRAYLPLAPLPLLELEAALVFAIFALPAFAAPAPEDSSPVLTGLARGLFLAVLAVPFALAARVVSPVSTGAVLAGCALTAAAGAGSVAAAAAFGARGLALGIAAAVLPGLAGFFGQALELPLGWLAGFCPFVAAETAVRGGAAWTLGLLPGIALLVVSQVLRRRQGRECPLAKSS